MFETLVSSRIRRALFEHILTHPDERFYLRGLAKQLNLSVSPLRRELMRLESAGVLKTAQEGSLRFYAVDTAAPVFLQLKSAGLPAPASGRQAGQQTQAPSPAAPAQVSPGQGGFHPPIPGPIPVGVVSFRVRPSPWRRALSGPALVGVAVVGMILVLGLAGLLYRRVVDRQLASRNHRALDPRAANVTVVVRPESTSGLMRGQRWQVVPGGFGGFSSGVDNESY